MYARGPSRIFKIKGITFETFDAMKFSTQHDLFQQYQGVREVKFFASSLEIVTPYL